MNQISVLQHRIAAALGVDERRRVDTVLLMHENNVRRAPGYWIQLFLAMGIATLGLVLSSTAVVIGAMLVSPLMGPILELGMGFAVGSSLLVLRAALRVFLSVISVVAGAALFTVALPFQEVTAEIAARTAPNALDLLIAVFCALTAVYTTVRPGAESTSAAAGTAIGIALVPPLCTIGFGIGTGAPAVAGGAALLFTANFSGILVVSVASFLMLGYNQVDAAALERRDLFNPERGATTTADVFAARAHDALGRVFGSRYGLAMRLLIPATFFAAVYWPLRNALHEVTWEVRARAAIRRVLTAEAPSAVQSSVTVDHEEVAIRLLLVTSMEHAAAIEQRITSRLADIIGVQPAVSVVPVADARALDARTTSARTVNEFSEQTTGARDALNAALQANWPSSAGTLLDWSLQLPTGRPATVLVRQLGSPLGPVGTALLANVLARQLNADILVSESPIPAQAWSSAGVRSAAWADSATALLRTITPLDSVVACVSAPQGDTARFSAADRRVWQRLGASGIPAQRLRIAAAGPWSVRAALGTCR